MKSPELNPCLYVQMISNNSANTSQWGKNNFLKDFPGGSVVNSLPAIKEIQETRV